MPTCSLKQPKLENDDLGRHQFEDSATVGQAQDGSSCLPPAHPQTFASLGIDDSFSPRFHAVSELPGLQARRQERDKARLLYLLTWIPLAWMGILLAACVAVSEFSLRIHIQEDASAILTSPLLTAVGLYLVAGEREWRWRFGFAMLAVGQFGCLVTLATPLSYIAASANLPLQDANFALIDRLLGFDWPAYYNFVIARPGLIPYATLFYAALMLSPFAVPLVLGLTGHLVRLQQFVIATVLTVVVVATVSAVLPAIGTYAELGLPAEVEGFRASGYLVQLEVLPGLRAGGLRVLDPAQLAGIITFPSFHAAASILAIWGFWSVWWLRPAALMVYVGMLLSTPLMGGHYFVDVIAGVGVAAFAIGASKRSLSPARPTYPSLHRANR